MITDPIADLIIRFKNAASVGKTTVVSSHSKMKENLIKVLQKEGFIKEYAVEGEGSVKILRVELNPGVFNAQRVSKPGRRVYAKKDEYVRAAQDALLIVSTSRGLMASEDAEKEGVGGELILKVWDYE